MKIGVISDIHIDVNKDYLVLETLAEAIRKKDLHCLIIAGDVSNHADMTLDFIQKLSSCSDRPVYFIPGNHDIWEQFTEHRDAGNLYEKFRSHPLCLLDSPVLLDKDVHLEMLARLEAQIQCFRDKKIIAVTHMITDQCFTVSQSRENWDYFNAFLGSSDYGALFEKYAVRYSIMGHVHFRKRLEQNGVSYICSCLNYSSEWQSKSIETEINDALTVLKL